MKRAIGFTVALGLLIATSILIAVPKSQKGGYEALKPPPGMSLTTKVVPPLTIEGPDRTFRKPIAQYSSTVSKLVFASNEPHLWPEELIIDWQAKSEPDDSLWARVPRPSHVWVANFGTGSLEYGDVSSWQVGTPAMTFQAIQDQFRERRLRQAEPMLTSKPVWWPDDETVAGTEAPKYGRVLPGRDALYYVLYGRKARTQSDFFGDFGVFSGPLRVVIQPVNEDPPRLFEYVLETDIDFVQIDVRFDNASNHLLAYSAELDRLWFVDLTDLWQESEIESESGSEPE